MFSVHPGILSSSLLASLCAQMCQMYMEVTIVIFQLFWLLMPRFEFPDLFIVQELNDSVLNRI